MERTAVFGVFHADSQADKAVNRLTSAGFTNSDISLLESNIETLMAHMEGSERVESYGQDGVTLLLVHCLDSLEIDKAHTILEQSGADRIFSTGEKPLSAHGPRRL